MVSDYFGSAICYTFLVLLQKQFSIEYTSPIAAIVAFYLSANMYFIVSIPLLNGKTPAAHLMNKHVLVDGQLPSVQRNLLHGLIYLPTLIVGGFLLVYGNRQSLDPFLGYRIYNGPKPI